MLKFIKSLFKKRKIEKIVFNIIEPVKGSETEFIATTIEADYNYNYNCESTGNIINYYLYPLPSKGNKKNVK